MAGVVVVAAVIWWVILLNAIIISQPPVFTALRSPSGAAVLHALPPILITTADPATAAPLVTRIQEEEEGHGVHLM